MAASTSGGLELFDKPSRLYVVQDVAEGFALGGGRPLWEEQVLQVGAGESETLKRSQELCPSGCVLWAGAQQVLQRLRLRGDCICPWRSVAMRPGSGRGIGPRTTLGSGCMVSITRARMLRASS